MVLTSIWYFILAYVAMLLVWIVGRLLYGMFVVKNELTPYRMLFSYASGLLVILVTYSIIKSAGQTINLWIIVLFITGILFYKPEIKFTPIKSFELINTTILSFVILFPVYYIQAFFYFDFANNTFRELHADHYFYSKIIDYLNIYGRETTSGNIIFAINKSDIGLNPYHYSELWIAGFFSKLFNISSISSYYIISIPIYVSIYCIGIYSYFRSFVKNIYIVYLIALFALFVGSIYFNFFADYEITKYHSATVLNIVSLFYQKLSLVYVFGFVAIILFINGERLMSYLVFLILPILSISFLPGVFGGIVIINILAILQKRGKFEKNNISPILMVALSFVYFIVFYSIFKSESSVAKVSSDYFLLKLINQTATITDIKIFIGNNVYRLVRTLIIYLPYFILLFFYQKPNKLLLFMFLIVLSGIVTSCLMFDLENSRQFGTNTYVLIDIFIVISIGTLITYFKKIEHKIISGIMLVLTIYIGVISLQSKNKHTNTINMDSELLSKIGAELDNKVVYMPYFLSREDFLGISNINWLFLKNDIYVLQQFTNGHVLFLLASSEDGVLNENLDFSKSKNVPNNREEFLIMKGYLDVKYLFIKNNTVGLSYLSELRYEKFILNEDGDMIVKLLD